MIRTKAPAWSSVLLLLLLSAPAWAQPQVFISELCDPRQNYLTDRFVEIYNAGPGSVDLTGWELVAVGNGGDVFVWPLSGSIASGQALVAGDASPVVSFPIDFPQEAWSDNSSLWNGKVGDGAKLVDASATVIDYVVADGTRFENEDYVRNEDVTSPSTTYDPSQWTATPVDFPTEGSPGTHTVESPVASPVVTGVRAEPASPVLGQPVDVRAEVTDDVANLVSVNAEWGLSAGSLSNVISMSVLSGDTWQTDEAIAPQPAGTTVYFRVEATNDLGGVTTTSTVTFSVPVQVSIFDIQGQALASPYDGQVVVTSGVVTARYGSHYTLQDGSGPWSGIWVTGASLPAEGDSVRVRAEVDENSSAPFSGNTVLRDASILSNDGPTSLPPTTVVGTGQLAAEAYEGVLTRIPDGRCTDSFLAGGDWEIDDGSGAFRVGSLGITPVPVLGTRYEVTGPIGYRDGVFAIEPSTASDVVFVADDYAPEVVSVVAPRSTEVHVDFSETIDAVAAEQVGNYNIGGVSIQDAQRAANDPSLVVLSVSSMPDGSYSLDVSGVEDLYGNVVAAVTLPFDYVDISPPPGYYDTADNLYGETLRAALHSIIDGHFVQSYASLWTAFYTTDDKPNGKVWDMYSDVPGGTPPYEYTFGVDEGGGGATEGEGYNREHSWPQSWYGGDNLPMYTDLFMVYPTDTRVNNFRGSLPYGEVSNPDWVSLNGSERGPNTTPGYTGTVFEPIDAYKGDFARTYFYVMARYYTEDSSWPASDMTDGADLLPWAEDLMLEWHEQDPVSRKEIERNQAVFEIQNNRNPFIDRPEFVLRMFSDSTDAPSPPVGVVRLLPVSPNPFNPATSIRFSLPEATTVDLSIYDVAGRLVRDLLQGESVAAGTHTMRWDGQNGRGRSAASGVYLLQLRANGERLTRRMTLLK